MQSLVQDLFADANKTATAGTVINSLMPAKGGLKSWIQLLQYKVGTTAHTITVMKPQGLPVTLAAAAAASQAVIVLSSDPGLNTTAGALAANDWLVLQQNDGSQVLAQVSSVSAGTGTQINVTLTASLANALNAGNAVWDFGAPGDGHCQYTTGTSDTELFGAETSFAGLAGSDRHNEPLIVQSNNATAAGTLLRVQGVYVATCRTR